MSENKTIEWQCEMSGCEQELENFTGDGKIYSNLLGRDIRCCEECYEEYTDLVAYGRPDYAQQWLDKTQEDLVA